MLALLFPLYRPFGISSFWAFFWIHIPVFHNTTMGKEFNRIMSGFHGAFATGVASQQGTLTLPDTWFRPPFWDLLMLQLLRPNSSNLQCLYSTFHLEYPLVLSRFCLASKCSEMEVPKKTKCLPNACLICVEWKDLKQIFYTRIYMKRMCTFIWASQFHGGCD